MRKIAKAVLMVVVLAGSCYPWTGRAGDAAGNTGQRNFRGNSRVALQGLPASVEGAYPIHLPTCTGIEQVLLLNNRWIVLVVSYEADVIRKIDELTAGELSAVCERWAASVQAGRPDWQAYKQRDVLRARYRAAARLAVGEPKLNKAETFTIRSPDDPSCQAPAHPRRVTQFPRPLGGNTVKYGGNIHWANYCFLEMPVALQTGKTYSVTLADGKRATFLYDELRTVSRAIKVNQALLDRLAPPPTSGPRPAVVEFALDTLEGAAVVAEAESFTVAEGFIVVPDAEASQGQSLALPGQAEKRAGTARLLLSVPESGHYRLRARVRWQHGCANSAALVANEQRVVLASDLYDRWHWVTGGTSVSLVAGENEMVIQSLESGIQLDLLEVLWEKP